MVQNTNFEVGVVENSVVFRYSNSLMNLDTKILSTSVRNHQPNFPGNQLRGTVQPIFELMCQKVTQFS